MALVVGLQVAELQGPDEAPVGAMAGERPKEGPKLLAPKHGLRQIEMLHHLAPIPLSTNQHIEFRHNPRSSDRPACSAAKR